jgi:hypothetical protein
MIESNPEAYEALFNQFKALHPEFSEEPAYSPSDAALRVFGKWAARALNAAIAREQPTTRGQSRLRTGLGSSDDGVAEWGVFVAENPEFLERAVEGEEADEALLPVTRRLLRAEGADELLPVTKRLLRGGVDE